jgi:hypothetical protein
MRARYGRTVVVYASVAVSCLFFSIVYAQYSHGVSSASMTFMFCYPLIGGAGVFTALALLRLPFPPRRAFNAYNSGIATLTVGSTLRGVFEIAGTSSSFQMVFTVVGVAFIVGALIDVLMYERLSDDNQQER